MKREMFGHALRKRSNKPMGRMMKGGNAEDNPPDYEGKEHVKYKEPGYTRHHINYPEDEPHMKSHVDSDEEHEMEDNFHMMGVPKQTDYTLPKKIERARMKMDAPDQEEPDALRGNMVHNVGYEGDSDTDGEEQYGPNDMQKEGRKKLIVAVMKRKMKRKDGYNKSLDEEEEHTGEKHERYEKAKRRRNE